MKAAKLYDAFFSIRKKCVARAFSRCFSSILTFSMDVYFFFVTCKSIAILRIYLGLVQRRKKIGQQLFWYVFVWMFHTSLLSLQRQQFFFCSMCILFLQLVFKFCLVCFSFACVMSLMLVKFYRENIFGYNIFCILPSLLRRIINGSSISTPDLSVTTFASMISMEMFCINDHVSAK